MSDTEFSSTLAGPPPAASATEEVDRAELIGGRFEILGLIGSGGMGNVYRARDTELGEIVALKMLHQKLVSSTEQLEQFRQEVRLARRVTHPNVARTFDIGEHGKQRFLTMEFLDGESLAETLRRERTLGPHRLALLAVPICRALAAAHEVAVVHRDLKPDNVLIARGGRVAITDFGIAHVAAEETGATPSTPFVVGTPAYMAPEQVEGRPLTAAADVYALGVMLFQMVTGELPWQGDTLLALLSARLVDTPPDPRALCRDLARPLAELIQRCLARDPAARPDAAEVARQLEEADAIVPASPTPPPAPVRSTPFSPADLIAGLLAPDSHGTPASRSSLAILPFRNAGSPADEHWAEGFTDDLHDSLSLLERLKVRARGAALPFQGSTLEATEIGRQLGVQSIVEGSVRRQGGTLRVVVRLVSVAEGFQIWGKRYDGGEGDLLSMADEASAAVAAALFLRAHPAGPALRDPAAIDLYLRARQDYARFDRAGALRARELIGRALELAPEDPRVVGMDAMVHTQLWTLALDSEPGAYERAMAAVLRAKGLAPEQAEPHLAAMAIHIQRLDLDAVVAELRSALAKNPKLVEAQSYLARLLNECDRLEMGCAILERCTNVDMSPEFTHGELARAHALLGDWTRAWGHLDLAANQHAAHTVTTRARLLCWSGRLDEARALHGRHAEPAAFGLRAMFEGELPPKADPGPRRLRREMFYLQLRAEVLAAEGREEDSLALLEELGRWGLPASSGKAQGLFDLAWLNRCPVFAGLRSGARRQRFAALRAEVATRAERIVFALLAT